MVDNIIHCKDCRHCFKDRRSRTGYCCEMWGFGDFADAVPLDGYCYKARPKINLTNNKEEKKYE